MSMYYLIFTDVKFIKLSQHVLLLNDCLWCFMFISLHDRLFSLQGYFHGKNDNFSNNAVLM